MIEQILLAFSYGNPMFVLLILFQVQYTKDFII